MSGFTVTVLGLVCSLGGVLLLFRYGMPFQVRTIGAIYRVLEQVDQKQVEREKRYTILGYLGLFLIIVGTILQYMENICLLSKQANDVRQSLRTKRSLPLTGCQTGL